MFLTRLHNFSRLPAAEKTLAARALGWLVLTRAGLRLLSFNRVHVLIAGRAPAEMRAGDAWPRAVRRAVLRAARSLPGSSCLAQSLVAERLLRAGGSRARLSIGVAPADATIGQAPHAPRVTLDAHAWVESGGVLVTGDDPHERYRILATFGAE
ncbi:MAG: lasso peptide biosynthesis B2 protein [Gemmatimonadales bacterium]